MVDRLVSQRATETRTKYQDKFNNLLYYFKGYIIDTLDTNDKIRDFRNNLSELSKAKRDDLLWQSTLSDNELRSILDWFILIKKSWSTLR